MEYRKLISFGKSSYVVSLPKPWVVQNKLKKGDHIYIEESGNNLILSKKESSEKKEDKRKIIDVDDKSPHWIWREVCSGYILNNHEIVLKGSEIKNKVKELQNVVQNLIALEIMEQTSDTIIAKDFLDMDNVSLSELIQKMDVVTRTMINEGCQVFKDCNYDSINDRDKDVNRLYFLLYRAALFNMENPTKAMKNFKLTPMDMLRSLFMGFYIEVIADEVRRTIRYARKIKGSPEMEKQIRSFLEKMRDYYVDTMKSFYKKDIELAFKISDLKMDFEKDLDKMESEVQKIEHLNKVVNQLQRLVTNIHNLGRIIYTLE
ncbi:phosphate uptake regulator PhoU [Candidatus Woesearchaeota archaeon]|nr:phosphate uptake regulator PhoU [Candidatus Woesearchaeota archaeon]MBT5342412.1 phosphate uptake regulator PhoU [Candidatus Woesearchaeota archaeon]